MKALVIIILVSVMTACSFTDRQITMSDLDKMLNRQFNGDTPGGAVLIVKGDKTLFSECYGLADINTREKITDKTLFNLGSISKTFVANGILILNQKGLLSIDDSLGKYFPDFRNPAFAEKVKLKHLLSHTSGLPDCRDVAGDPAFFITAKDKENFEPIKQTDIVTFNPGEKYEYSNPAFNGLALIIEEVTGMPWQKFIAENIFLPSGMTTSTITDGPHPETGVAHGYEFRDGEYHEYDYGEYPTFAAAGNGGVWSSVTELVAYEKALGSAVFLDRQLIEESRTVFRPENWNDTLDPFIGYSWFAGEESLFGCGGNYNISLFYHLGDQGGFRAFLISIPEHDLIFTGLFNTPPEDMMEIIKTGMDILKSKKWFE